MPFKLQSNPLENNALFAAPETEQPQKQEKAKKSGKAAAQSAKTEKKQPVKPEPEQIPEEYIRATFIVRTDLLSRLKDYAYTDRREIKAVINEILEKSLDEIEAAYAKRGEKILHAPK